ncbi:MAG TPA: MEDS domain-containing protein [Nitrososphaera sp.]|nr:MEDS domain-containing protein [Nitrososphaera sp.]
MLKNNSRALRHSHSICVFDSSERKNYWHVPIYQKVRDYIADGYSVIYILEPEVQATIQQMSSVGIEAQDHVVSGALTIISNDIFYSPLVASPILIEQWYKLFENIEKKNGKPKGFVAIGMPSSSFFTSLLYQEHLVEYESTVAKSYDGGVEALCCYTTRLMENMPLRHIVGILNAHQNIAHRDLSLSQWSAASGMTILKNGLIDALGTGGAEILFNALRRTLDINEDDVILRPNDFENSLRTVLGSTAAEITLEKLKGTFNKNIAF